MRIQKQRKRSGIRRSLPSEGNRLPGPHRSGTADIRLDSLAVLVPKLQVELSRSLFSERLDLGFILASGHHRNVHTAQSVSATGISILNAHTVVAVYRSLIG